MFRLCPYKSSGKNNCTHKGTKSKRMGKRVCAYKYEHNCPLFVEWLEKSGKVPPRGLKMDKKGNLVIDDE